MNNYSLLDAVSKVLKEHEGWRSTPYKCSLGYTTVGYGRNLDTNPLTPEEGEYLLNSDLKKTFASLDRILPDWEAYEFTRQVALIDMMYQLGPSRFGGFTKMLNAIENDDWDTASKECLDSLYAKQVPNRAKKIAHWLEMGNEIAE